MLNNQRLNVVVLAGGLSAEREISLKSGHSVASALKAAKHRVTIVDPAHTPVERFDWTAIDACFIALHGAFGEDGQIQQQLADFGVPFTGSDAQASRLAFSKIEAKRRFNFAGIPTPPFEILSHDDSEKQINLKADHIGYPLVVKPDQQGSSLGVHILNSDDQLLDAVQNAFLFGDTLLIERAIPGTEWTVAVVGDEVLPVMQIETIGEFFDYDAKYINDQTRYRFEFDNPSVDPDLIATTGLQACEALGASGVARVDLRLDHEFKPWVLEVNTVPGFTDHSLVPKAAKRAGISFIELCETSLQLALKQQSASHLARRAS